MKNKDFTIISTIFFIQEAHSGQYYGKLPYFMHPLEVAQKAMMLVEIHRPYTSALYELPVMLTALLHDVIEDTKYTEEDLLALYDEEIVEAVKLLSRNPEDSYLDMIQKIIDSDNEIAMIVKLADNHVNRNGDKSGFSKEKAERLNDRYDASIKMLTQALMR